MEIKLVSFYKFVWEIQKLIDENGMFKKRVYFDVIYPKLKERLGIGLDQFKLYLHDLNMIFTTKIVLNPANPDREIAEPYRLPLGPQAGYADSLVMLGS